MGNQQAKQKQKDISELEKTLKVPKNEVEKIYEDLMGRCPSGYVTFKEIENSIKISGVSTDLVYSVMKEFDKSNDGKISIKEYILTIATLSSSTPKQRIELLDNIETTSAFDIFDLDKSGFLTIEEVKEMIGTVGRVYQLDDTEKKSAEIFKELDVDGDNKISKEEFVRVCEKNDEITSVLKKFIRNTF